MQGTRCEDKGDRFRLSGVIFDAKGDTLSLQDVRISDKVPGLRIKMSGSRLEVLDLRFKLTD